MYGAINKSPLKRLLSYGYCFAVRIPRMLIGYCKDRTALYRNLSDPVFEDLKWHGLHTFTDQLSAEEISTLLSDFENLKKNNILEKSGQGTGRIFSYGILSPLLAEYAEKIKPHVANFLNIDQVKVEISYYQESYPQMDLENIPGGDFHVDDNKANLKYFIYLTDVTKKNGPFSCVPSTGSWKLKGSLVRGILYELTGKRKYHYSYRLNLGECVKNERLISGLAGTHFLVDTTTLHRARPVTEGFRKVAVISFNRP